jgi:hypothetical protein
VSINSGLALLIFIPCFFGLVLLAGNNPAIASIFPVALTGMTGAFAGFLMKRHAGDKNLVERERMNLDCKK